MSNWTDVNRLRLIKAFQKNPILWCKSHAGYSLVEKRKEALTELTHYMNKYEKNVVFTEDDIKTQLKNLKDMYRRKVKRMQQMKAAAQKVEEPCWFYFEHLKFLDSNFERPQSADSLKSNEDGTSNKRHSDSIPEFSKTEPSSPEYIKSEFDEGLYNDNPPSVNSRPKNPINSGPLAKKPRIENNYLQRSDSDDELSIFGQFVGRTLRKLSASSAALAIQVKKQINDILCEAELEACQMDLEMSNSSI